MVHGTVPPQGQDFVLASAGPPGVQVSEERKTCILGLRCTLLSLTLLLLTFRYRLDFLKEVLLFFPSLPDKESLSFTILFLSLSNTSYSLELKR